MIFLHQAVSSPSRGRRAEALRTKPECVFPHSTDLTCYFEIFLKGWGFSIVPLGIKILFAAVTNCFVTNSFKQETLVS